MEVALEIAIDFSTQDSKRNPPFKKQEVKTTRKPSNSFVM